METSKEDGTGTMNFPSTEDKSHNLGVIETYPEQQ